MEAKHNPLKAMLQIRKVYFTRKIDFGGEEKKFYNFSQSFSDTAGVRDEILEKIIF